MNREKYQQLIERARRAERTRDRQVARANLKVEEAWRQAAFGLAKLMEKRSCSRSIKPTS